MMGSSRGGSWRPLSRDALRYVKSRQPMARMRAEVVEGMRWQQGSQSSGAGRAPRQAVQWALLLPGKDQTGAGETRWPGGRAWLPVLLRLGHHAHTQSSCQRPGMPPASAIAFCLPRGGPGAIPQGRGVSWALSRFAGTPNCSPPDVLVDYHGADGVHGRAPACGRVLYAILCRLHISSFLLMPA